jgi:predicted sulfurtransferase
MKVVPIPDYDKSTHKWCNLCESVKEHSCFYKARQTKDGLCANCKACKHQQKIANKEKKAKNEKKDNHHDIMV